MHIINVLYVPNMVLTLCIWHMMFLDLVILHPNDVWMPKVNDEMSSKASTGVEHSFTEIMHMFGSVPRESSVSKKRRRASMSR